MPLLREWTAPFNSMGVESIFAGKTGGTDHVFLVNGRETRHIDASREPLTYFKKFIADVRDRTETAMAQHHVFTVSRLSLEAQAAARPLGALAERRHEEGVP